MGLIGKVEKKMNAALDVHESATFIKKKTGLLDKIIKSCSYDSIRCEFQEVLLSIGAERGGLLFFDQEQPPSLLFSQGLDITTFRRFCPSQAFIQKHCIAEEWNIFSQIELTPFSPFFSSHEKDSLEKIYLKKINFSDPLRNCWILLVESKLDIRRSSLLLSKISIHTLQDVLQNHYRCVEILYPAPQIPLSHSAIAERAKSACTSGKIATLLFISISKIFNIPEEIHSNCESMTIYNGLIQQIKKKTGLSNIVHIDKYNDVRIVIFSSQIIDHDLYVHQILQPLKDLFGFNRISRISFEVSGSTQEVQDILDFIDGR